MNKKLKQFEIIILILSILLVLMNSPIKNYINMKQKTMFFAMLGIFSIIAVLGIIFIITRFFKEGKVIKECINDSVIIIKSNYVFFVISYLLIFIIFPELYNEKIEILTDLIDRILNGKILNKFQSIIYLIIVAPVMEELFFRRLLFRILRKIKINWIIIITSILFMISHDNMDISKFIVGIGLSRLYLKYDRIELNIVIHSIINLISMLIGIFSVLLIPDGVENSLYILIPLILILPNYKFWIEKIFLKKVVVNEEF
ncbi:MAG: CPBP family intramembrane metalloprotease [Bacteroidales bacterium]|nr:CPBP family intramembrane metalloprotease [Bacteroidales bacterium]